MSISNVCVVSIGKRANPANGDAGYQGPERRKGERREQSAHRVEFHFKQRKRSTVDPAVGNDAWKF
ncbi:MAG: hypothetical protein OEU36_14240 [Gammaproteobacteria bacterium]|nr:hypothetical protein [Gammaproteobacteria bacterium]